MSDIRNNWQHDEITALFARPLLDLVYDAQTMHRRYFPANQVQRSTLLSIKTGTCPEDCGYCPQSGHHNTGLKKESLIPLEDVIAKANIAKANGASRFCMGAAWRNPSKKDFPKVLEMIKAVKSIGLESCVTLGMLDDEQAQQLKEAGLDYYNHNIDTSREYYKTVTQTRTFDDRLETLARVRDNNIHVCCGGIVGMGESAVDRVSFLQELANLPEHPESVPINRLVAVKGTPLGNSEVIDDFEFVKTIAVARIIMPKSYVRLSAGRETMNDAMQALCFMAGANSVFYGDKLLTTANPELEQDLALFARLGITPLIPLNMPTMKEQEETACA